MYTYFSYRHAHKAQGYHPSDTKYKKTIDNQHQTLDKFRQISAILKGNLEQKQKSHASWLVTTMKNIIEK